MFLWIRSKLFVIRLLLAYTILLIRNIYKGILRTFFKNIRLEENIKENSSNVKNIFFLCMLMLYEKLKARETILNKSIKLFFLLNAIIFISIAHELTKNIVL